RRIARAAPSMLNYASREAAAASSTSPAKKQPGASQPRRSVQASRKQPRQPLQRMAHHDRISGLRGHVRSAGNSNANMGGSERWGIINAVAHHRHNMTV